MKIHTIKLTDAEFTFVNNSIHRHWHVSCCNDTDCPRRRTDDMIRLHNLGKATERLFS